MTKIGNKLILLCTVLMLAVFLPVLFCVIFIGNNMNYNEGLKLAVLHPNYVLFLIVLVGMGICGFLLWICRKIRLTRKINWMANGIFFFLFFGLYFITARIAREIAFMLPWDVSIVRNMAYVVSRKEPIGYFYYLSIYTNNIPISYILGRIHRKALEMAEYPYIADYMWIQVNCILISVAGYFTCLSVKKLTRQLMPAVVAFFAYLILAEMSPWMIAPYTDTYGMAFPIMSIYFYISYRKADKMAAKCLYIALALSAGALGGFIKPSLYIIVIAILGVECLLFIKDYKKNWKFLLVEALLSVGLVFSIQTYTDDIIQEIGFDYNEEISAGWPEYLLMGSNEGTTGSYNGEDATIFGEFQESKSDRRAASIERAVSRMEERGFFGSLYFWLRKMTMTFNDGTFGWRGEVWIQDYYPDGLASNTALTEFLRMVYWGETPYTGAHNTILQLVWMFCIVGFPGVCLCNADKREEYAVLVVSFLGIFFYQVLFEARARYLFSFLPLLIVISMCGIWQYVLQAVSIWQKREISIKMFAERLKVRKER